MNETNKIDNQKFKITEKLISLITLIIYLLISFITGSWHITWIMWIIYVLVMEIVKLIFLIRGYDVGEDKTLGNYNDDERFKYWNMDGYHNLAEYLKNK